MWLHTEFMYNTRMSAHGLGYIGQPGFDFHFCFTFSSDPSRVTWNVTQAPCRLGCDIVWLGRKVPTFRRTWYLSLQGRRLSGAFCETTRQPIQEDFHIRVLENLKSHTRQIFHTSETRAVFVKYMMKVAKNKVVCCFSSRDLISFCFFS
jgi:hypothetical protein